MKRVFTVPFVVFFAFVSGALFVERAEVYAGSPTEPLFVRADANGDGRVNIADPSFVANAIFIAGAKQPPCDEAADANDDGSINIADPSFIANAIFISGSAQPSPPFPDCGVDPDPPGLGCVTPPVACDPDAIPIEGFVFAGMNVQGYPEYIHDQTGIVFVLLPGGKFNMGAQSTDPEGANYDPNAFEEESPVHEVTLSPFLIAKTEVTQAQYLAIMGVNPSENAGCADCPVEVVSWDTLKAPDGFLERTGLSLPSEAQWEYAARGGTSTAFSFGDDCNADTCDPCAVADDFMWWCGNSETGNGPETNPVASKLPNPFGLHDVHGNVWEWCEDVWDRDFYSSPDAAGPDPVSTSGSGNRVIRGGYFVFSAAYCRSAFRDAGLPSDEDYVSGVRPARSLP